jgi:peptidyl-dipeptidase Dcp
MAAVPPHLAPTQDVPPPPAAPAPDNPLLTPSPLPFSAPPFHRIRDEHFAPALEWAMARAREEVDAIVADPAPPTFQSTIVALERAGRDLDRIWRIFSALTGAHTNPRLQAVQREMAPLRAAHRDAIFLDPGLFARIRTLHESRDTLALGPEDARLLERYHTDFVRAGALLSHEQQARLREINARLAELETAFGQRVLEEVNASALVVESREDLAGLSAARMEAAAREAAERGLEGRYVLTLQNTSGQPCLADLRDRSVRERLHRASLSRGSRGGDLDTRSMVVETATLRGERARMLGFPSHAAYILVEQTAGTIGAVEEMLSRASTAAVANARREGGDLQARIDATEETPFELASWDWAYYTEQLRTERFDVDQAAVRPYFELGSVLENGVFHSATRLFGLTFRRRGDLPVYHPDVEVWEVLEEDGTPLGLMYADFYARTSKRGGAWMNSYVPASGLLGTRPVTGNHLNLTKPPEGEPTLLTWDEVTTLFHEFGHVLHGLLSGVTYPRFSGTAVPRDFVEFPSQVFEMWAAWPEVLANYARHHATGEPIPRAILDRLMAAEQFNEGFRFTEYLAAAVTDLALHRVPPEELPTAEALLDFEAEVLRDTGLDYAPVPPRYRFPYFSHIMGGYSAGYYSYLWSEVLDADSVEWFRENGGLTRENGERYRRRILARGGSMDAMEMYRDFAGRDPAPTHLLRRRGLLPD